ncbi:uncharacterized protein LOC132066147 [Lycium ferocissimum]|uniref:uncharacterized protein LOC132066147 n=1 Tax=Lycium ferocissimum TaxID=112874 RepID=UPI002814E9C3|nr:uncharacterized protein LOC132066147 [Lycium ferocissimum]
MSGNRTTTGNNTSTFRDGTATEGFSHFTIDPSHTYYVHPSDNPGSQLVYVPFNGSGFVIWRSSILTCLSAKNKLGVIDSKLTIPTPDSPYFPYWERCNDMVKSWIVNSVSREIATSVVCFKTAKEVWEDINQRFGNSNGSRYIQIQREISSTIQGSSDISSYFTKLRNLWDELNCAYVGPSTILMMNPLPSISKAYSILQQDESQRESTQNSSFTSDSTAFFTSNSHNTFNKFNPKVNFDAKRAPGSSNVSFDLKRGSGPNNGSGGLFCKYCKKTNHTIEKCYKLHGYPPDYKFTKNKKVASLVQSENQFQPPSFQPSSMPPPQGTTTASSPSPHGLFTAYAVNSASSFGPSQKRPLVIGKAAGRLYYLHPDDELFPSSSSAITSHCAAEHTSSNCIPVAAPSTVVNNSQFSVMSNVITRVSIDISTPSPNVVLPTCNQSCTINKMDLIWHQRLGHVPFHKMKTITSVAAEVSTKQPFICQICPMARQQRLPFQNSTIRSTVPFQLVHIDIWGPYNTTT